MKILIPIERERERERDRYTHNFWKTSVAISATRKSFSIPYVRTYGDEGSREH